MPKFAEQTWNLEYKLGFDPDYLEKLEKQKDDIIQRFMDDKFYDIHLDLYVDDGLGEATLTLVKDYDVKVEYASIYYDEDNDACFDPEPPMIEGEPDIDDITYDVKLTLGKYGLEIIDVFYNSDSVDTIISNLEEIEVDRQLGFLHDDEDEEYFD